jgi:hypothetical protein
MSLFKNLGTEGLAEKEDRIGGSRVLNTEIYEGTIKMAYAQKSTGGALGITLIMMINGSEFSTTQYVTDKNGNNFFHPKDANGQPNLKMKNPLPGFTIIDDLCLVTTGAPLKDQETEQKTVRIYNFDEKKELPTVVDAMTDLIGTTAYFAMFKDLVNVEERDSNNMYQVTDKTREQNEIVKVCHHPSKVTVKEQMVAAEAGQDSVEPVWFDEWRTKWVDPTDPGKVRDRRKVKDGAGTGSGRPGQNASSPPVGSNPTSGGGAKKAGLFGKK